MIYYSLSDDKFTLQDDIEVVIHLSAISQESLAVTPLEEKSFQQLVSECRRVGAHLIYISSQTVLGPLISNYARSKANFEKYVFDSNGTVLRLGQVYGGREKGLFGAIVNFCKISPILPQFLPSPKVQPVHVSDVAAAILILARNRSVGIYQLANSSQISFNKFLRLIGEYRVKEFRILLPIPVKFVSNFLILFKFIPNINNARIRFNTLLNLPYMEPSEVFIKNNFLCRQLTEGMSKSGSCKVRGLIIEGRIIARYILKAEPSPEIIKRYVRFSSLSNDSSYLSDCKLINKYPALLGFYHAALDINKYGIIKRKIEQMVVIAEASVSTHFRYLPDCSGCKKFKCLLTMALSVVNELIIKIILVVRRFLGCWI